jgi:hypothetical protein
MSSIKNSESICAWVVGVEAYASAGDGRRNGLDIDAPIGRWALDLALSLSEREPGIRLAMNLSLADRPEYRERLATLAARGHAPQPATQQGLQNSLRRLHGQGTLLVYWVGHGLMDTRSRYLLCADSSSITDLRALSVDSLLMHLRGKDFPRVQIGFFDACAQVMSTPNVLTLGGASATLTNQYFFFAASATEIAPANTTGKGFSNTVVAALRDTTRAFPPNPEKLFAELLAAFQSLPAATQAFPMQWTYRSGEFWSEQGVEAAHELREQARRAYLGRATFEHVLRGAGGCVTANSLSVALRANQMPSLLAQVRHDYNGSPHPDLLEDAWQRLQIARSLESECAALGLFWHEWIALRDYVCGRDHLGTPINLENLTDLLIAMLDQTNKTRGYDSCIRLLELAARRTLDSSASASAKELRKAVVDHPELGPRYEDAVAQLPNEDRDVYLLIGLRYDSDEKTASIVGSWLFVDGKEDNPWSLELPQTSFAAQIHALIQRALVRHRRRRLIVELMVPNELLCAPRPLLEIIDDELETRTWLEAKYAITLRWHERMKNPDPRYEFGTWVRQADNFGPRARNATQLKCIWHGDRAEGEVVGLAVPGPSPTDPLRNRGQFFQFLTRGAPYMCWPREAPPDVESFKRNACQFFLEQRLATLPDALRAAKGSPGGLLHDLLLLIDEPCRNPYQRQFQDPPQRGQQQP